MIALNELPALKRDVGLDAVSEAHADRFSFACRLVHSLHDRGA